MEPSAVLALQRTVGNRAVSRILSRPASDEFEEEAIGFGMQPMGLPPAAAPQPAPAPAPTADLTDAAEELSFLHGEKVRRRF